MVSKEKELFERRREFVNREVAIKLMGKRVSRAEQVKIFRNAWRLARKKIK